MSRSVSTPTGERLSLGSATSPVATARAAHALPSINTALSGSNDAPTSASLITKEVVQLATPLQQYVDSQALHTLATEMVFTLVQSSRFVSRKQTLAREEMQQAGFSIPPDTTASTELDSMVTARLEAIGFHVGSNLAEQLSRERTRFTETLEVLKFVCKEVWTAVWGKQVDNLRTNHRGVYVLQDNAFRPLTHLSTTRGSQETARESKLFLAYPVGIVRGALAQLDVPSVVIAETNQTPQCTFHVKTQRSAPAATS